MTANPSSGPQISVIVPVYRAARTIEQCLESLLTQDAAPESYEVLLVHNGEDDGGIALAEQLAAAHPDRIVRALHSPVASAGAARNLGLDQAKGSHILLVDADDWVSPNYVSAMSAAADGISVPVAGLVDVDATGTIDEDTPVMRSLRNKSRPLHPVDRATAVAAISACKLFPANWLEGVRFRPGLRSGEDVVFNADLFTPFARQFAQFNLAPFRAGARYFRRLTADSVSRQEQSYDFSVTQRLAVIAALTSGIQAHPDDRSSLTRLFVDSQAAMLKRYLDEHPQDRLRAQADLVAEGITGVDLSSGSTGLWPGYRSAMTRELPSRSTRVALVSGSSTAIPKRKHQIQMLRDNELAVRAAFLSGPLGSDFPQIPRHRFVVVKDSSGDSSGGSGRLAQVRRRVDRVDRMGRKLGRRVIARVVPPQIAARALPTTDAKGWKFLLRSDVVALDSAGAALARGIGREPHPVEWFDARVLATAAVAKPMSGPQAAAVAKATESLAKLPVDSPLLPPPQVWTLAVWRLLRNTRIVVARTILARAVALYPESAAEHGFDVLGLLAEVLEHGTLNPGASDACRATMAAADALLDAGAVDHAMFLTELVIEVLFHSEINANVADPPLIRDPSALLAPLASSRIWELLTSPVSEHQPQAPALSAAPQVLVLPGAYPKFAGAIESALAGHAVTDVLRLTDFGAHFGTTGPAMPELMQRLAAARGQATDVSSDIVHAFADREVVFADWADKGAMLASLFTPPGARLVVRFHGVDSLGVWQFLIDWSRVTDVVFVSEHLRRTVVDHLGQRLDGVRQHVTGNVVDVDRFHGDTLPGANRTLGLVGWGQKVKDPLWAVEVLARLREQDPAWRLKLIGADFPPHHTRASEARYAAAFRERVARADLVDAISYVGFTRHLPDHLRDVGFALSTSLRESWHIGVVEMVAAGAVPVVRNWPVYRDAGGARSLFPADWVVDTPDEAAARILAHADQAQWRVAADAARAYVRENFAGDTTAQAYREIILR